MVSCVISSFYVPDIIALLSGKGMLILGAMIVFVDRLFFTIAMKYKRVNEKSKIYCFFMMLSCFCTGIIIISLAVYILDII